MNLRPLNRVLHLARQRRKRASKVSASQSKDKEDLALTEQVFPVVVRQLVAEDELGVRDEVLGDDGL